MVSGVDLKCCAAELRPAADPWPGHVIVIASSGERRYLIDPSFDQCSMPDQGVSVPPYVLIAPIRQHAIEPENLAAELALVTDSGETLNVRYWPFPDRSFIDSQAWETDHLRLVIEMICERMEEPR